MFENVLFLGCHCDDIELGCGGTINHFSKKWDISCAIFSTSGLNGKYKNLKETSEKSLNYLGVNKIKFFKFKTGFFSKKRQKIWEKLNNLNLKNNPDIIFVNQKDEHQDHGVLNDEAVRVFRKKTIIEYNIIRSSLNFESNLFISLNECDVKAKLKSLSFYKMYNEKNYFNKNNLKSHLRNNGIYIESDFAESFKIKKFILNEKP